MEQLFSVLKRSPAELASAKADTDRRLAVVAGGGSFAGEEAEIVARARTLYSKLLVSGKARASVRKTRVDANTSGLKFRKASEKEWARKRSHAIRKATQSPDLTTPPRRPPRELPESLAKEVRNQEKQALKRKAEAYLDGTLLSEEATPEVVKAAQQKEKSDVNSDKTRRKNFLKVNAALASVKRKESYAWALQNLPSPAYFVGAGDDSEKRRWAGALAKAGVPAITEDA